MQVISKSKSETRKIAAGLAGKLKKQKPGTQAIVVALEGELGAGKTTFVQAFARALGVKSHITSPTFVILKKYPLPAISYKLYAISSLIHIDAYRLKDHRDLVSLGIKEILADPQNLVLIEWSDRVAKVLPKNHIKIHIDHIDKTTRKIQIST